MGELDGEIGPLERQVDGQDERPDQGGPAERFVQHRTGAAVGARRPCIQGARHYYVRIRVGIVCLALAAALPGQGPSGNDLYLQGRRAERAGHMAEAYLLYSQAAAMSPQNKTYWQRSLAVRTRAALEAKVAPPAEITLTEPSTALEAASAPPLPIATSDDRAEARKLLPPVELQAQTGRQDFDLHGAAKALFEKVAKSFGLDCLFDDDFQAGASFRFQMADSDYRDTLHGLEAATGSFVVPLSKRVFLVVKDTPQKRTDREPTVAIELHLPEASNPQDFNAIVTAVQQAFAIEKVAFDTQNNSVILRDRVSKVFPARLMFEDLMSPRAQVIIELKFLEVSRNDAITRHRRATGLRHREGSLRHAEQQRNPARPRFQGFPRAPYVRRPDVAAGPGDYRTQVPRSQPQRHQVFEH